MGPSRMLLLTTLQLRCLVWKLEHASNCFMPLVGRAPIHIELPVNQQVDNFQVLSGG